MKDRKKMKKIRNRINRHRELVIRDTEREAPLTDDMIRAKIELEVFQWHSKAGCMAFLIGIPLGLILIWLGIL